MQPFSRHLHCCTFVVCYGRAARVHKRVVLYLTLYCTTQNVPYYVYQYTVLPIAKYLGFEGVCVPLTSRQLLSVYVFAVCYGCAALCMNVSYYVYRYIVQPRTYRTMCTFILCYLLHSTWNSRVCASHLLRGTWYVYVYAVCYGCAALCIDLSYYVYRYAVLLIA